MTRSRFWKRAKVPELKGARERLRDIFNTPVMPRKERGIREDVVPELRLYRLNEEGHRALTVVAPALKARAVTCSGCGKSTGPLRRIAENTYAHAGCAVRASKAVTP